MARNTTPSLVIILCLLVTSLLPAGAAHASPSPQAAPSVTVSGTVHDAVLGWPLYARITVTTGAGPLTSFTDPRTGAYRVALPPNGTYTFSVEAVSAGYQTATRAVAVGSGDQTELFTLEPDHVACSAPGHLRDATILLSEDFSAGALPAGWSNIDNITTHASPQDWRFDDPGNNGNLTGGAGGFAVAHSDFYGSGQRQDMELRTPAVTPVAGQIVLLEFDSDFRAARNEKADVDVSLDGGATWSNVWRRTESSARRTHERVVLAPAASGQPMLVRFRYYDTIWDWWWQIDNVVITSHVCTPQPGGLLIGHVYDANIGQPLTGATVARGGAPAATATSIATPDDPALDDGLYIIAAPTGTHAFTAALPPYTSVTASLPLALGQVLWHDFQLPAGYLSSDPPAVTLAVAAGRTATYPLTLRNTGGAGLTYTLQEFPGPQPAPSYNALEAPAFEELPAMPTAVARAAGAVVGDSFYVFGGEYDSGITDLVQRYDIATGAWDTTPPPLPSGRANLCVGVIGTDIYLSGGTQTNILPTNTLQIFHTSTATWETVASDPLPIPVHGPLCAVHQGKLYAFGGQTQTNAYSSAAYVYDPAAPAGARWSPLAPMPIPAGYGGAVTIGGRIYLAGLRNSTADLATVLVYDVAGDSWSTLPDLRVARGGARVWAVDTTLYVGGGGWNASLASVEAYDTAAGASGSWRDATPLGQERRSFTVASDPATQAIYVAGGVRSVTVFVNRAETLRPATDVPWLSESPTSGAVAAGTAQVVSLSVDASALPEGTYHAQLKAVTDAPAALRVPVTLVVGHAGLQLAAPITAQTDAPGAVVRYSLTLTNTGTITDSFALALAGHSWPATLSAPTLGPLAPGAAATAEIAVSIPGDAPVGAADTVQVTATSLADDGQTGAASLTTSASEPPRRYARFLPLFMSP